MESNHTYHEEESMNSSEDEHENIDLGVGRSYECVFCKRGFNTAQALGGHMNIHRKDRARNKQANIINSSKQEESNYTGPRLYQQIIPAGSHRFPVHDHHHHQQQQQQQKHLNNFATYFPESSSSATRSSLYGNSNYHHDDDSDHRQPLDPSVPGDWRMSFSLDFSPSMIMEDHLENNRSQVMNHKEDLDLELRLGYD